MAAAPELAPLPPFIQPSRADVAIAARLVDSRPVISAYRSVEWDCLDGDGQIWIAAIVREARKEQTVPGEKIVEINTFLVHMAKHFRRRTSHRFLGIRINTMTRTEAMGHALATYDAQLDLTGVPFGHPDHAWDRQAAHNLVDTELQHWEV